jgi:hypothetical protein
MSQLAKNVPARFTLEWFAAAGVHTAAWETYQVRLVTRLSKDKGGWGVIRGAYATLALFRANPNAAANFAGLIQGLEQAASVLERHPVRPLLATESFAHKDTIQCPTGI